MRIDKPHKSVRSARGWTGTPITQGDRCAFMQMATRQMGLNARGLSAAGHGRAQSAVVDHSVDHKPEKRPAATGDPGG